MLRNLRKWYPFACQIALFVIWLLSAPGYQAKEPAQSGYVSPSELILAMNTLRVAHGLPALIEDPIVNAVAQGTADIMAANNMSWHIGDVRGRIAAAGYGGGSNVWATENFAVGRMSIDQIMQAWADPDHMRPAVNPAYCHVGAGVAQADDGRYYYILQAAYTSDHACGEYISPVPSNPGDNNPNPAPPVSQIIIPVKLATPDAEGKIYHIVRSGQSFWAIAIAYQITIRDLEIWNNLSRDNGLVVGQKLFIPSGNTAGYATPTPVGMVVLATPNAEGKVVHEVQPYQSLLLIADAYKVKLNALLAINGWQADWPLQIGQKLLIDPGNVTLTPTPRPLTALEQLTPASDGNYYHTVQSGEFLGWIANLYEISLNELLAWNGLTTNAVIRPGQQLLLRVTPPATATPTPAPPTATLLSPTSTLSPTTTPELTPTTQVEIAEPDENNPPGIITGLAVILAASGLSALGWTIWQRTQKTKP